MNQDSKQCTGNDRTQSAADHRLKRTAQGIAGETLQTLGEVMDAEQEEAQSTHHRHILIHRSLLPTIRS